MIDPYADVDERGCDFLYGRKPKKLKEGRTKYNEPKFEEVEKALIEATASKDNPGFEVRRGMDMLTKVLGNPEHRGRVHGMSSRKSWKTVESWQTDAATYRSRQRYKEGLIQKGYDSSRVQNDQPVDTGCHHEQRPQDGGDEVTDVLPSSTRADGANDRRSPKAPGR